MLALDHPPVPPQSYRNPLARAAPLTNRLSARRLACSTIAITGFLLVASVMPARVRAQSPEICGFGEGSLETPIVEFYDESRGAVWCGTGYLVGTNPFTQSLEYTFLAEWGASSIGGTFELLMSDVTANPSGTWTAINIVIDYDPGGYYTDDTPLPPGTAIGFLKVPGSGNSARIRDFNAYLKSEEAVV